MNKTELKKKLEDVKSKLKTNSKDAHFADALIGELLSIKGQIDIEPTMVNVRIDDIADYFDGGNFEMCVTKDGTAVYRTRGGYTVVADDRIVGLNATIRNFIAAANNEVAVEDIDKDILELELTANTHVLNIPMVAFSDAKLKFDLATIIVKYLRDTYEAAINAPLQDDDTKLNRIFEDGVKASIEISDELKKMSES